MIYVIFDESHEWDDFYYGNSVIVYIGTDKDAAIAYFNKYFGDTATLDNTKWHYTYTLCEFQDGWNKYDPQNGDWSGENVNVLLTADNDTDEDNEK